MKRVLIIDDEPQVGEIMSMILARAGHQVSTAVDFTSAQRTWDACNGSFDVLLCDAYLPEGMGQNLVAQFREQNPSLKVVICTGAEFDLDPGTGYLRKPFSSQELLQALE